jgi:hypothetical protein
MVQKSSTKSLLGQVKQRHLYITNIYLIFVANPKKEVILLAMTKYVAYFRVNTVRQGQSSLGLEAHQAAVQNFRRGDALLVATFLEIESGKKNEQPQLATHRARLQCCL